MDPSIIAVAVVVVSAIVLVLILAGKKNAGSSGGAGAVQMRMAPEDAQHEIRRLLSDNKKILAIKLYREVYGVGLKDAKDAVEAMEIRGFSGMDPVLPRPSIPTASSGFNVGEDQIRTLIETNRKIEAIKIYREQYNCDLLTAKNAVEAIEREMKLGR